MNTTLTVAMIMQMMEGDYVPYEATPRSFTKERVHRSRSIKNKKIGQSFNVNQNMRRNHNIKQPGVDVQRRSYSTRFSKNSSIR
jgi:hypothetical protein